MANGSNMAQRRTAARKEGSPAYLEKLSQVVAAAAVVFKEKGYETATLNDVAEMIGTDRASLYYYVGSKEELLRDAVRDIATVNTEAARQIMMTEVPPREKINQFITKILLSYDANYPQVFVFLEQDLGKLTLEDNAWARSMILQVRKIEGIIMEMLQEGVADGSFRADLNVEYVAKALWGMLNWTHRWYKPTPADQAREIADTFSGLFLDGLATSLP